MRATTRQTVLISLLLVLFAGWGLSVGAQPAAGVPGLLTTITPVYGDETARPVAMLTVHDPWAMVLGADSPAFVLYESGQVIYQRAEAEHGVSYWSATLDEDEFAALVEALDVDAFAALDEDYDLVPVTDQPTQVFWVRTEKDGIVRVRVYGSLMSDAKARATAPDVLVNAFDEMTGFDHPDAEPWLPEKFEVILWPWRTSDAVEWPTDWPQLDSPFAVEREHVTSIYLGIGELERFLTLATDASALRLDGDTYAFSLRLPFPHEVTWPTYRPTPAP